MADKDVKYRISADDAPFLAAIRRVDSGLRSMDTRVGGAISGIATAVGRIAGTVSTVGALLAGGSFAAGIANAIRLQDEMGKSAQRSGLTTEAFSTMAYAAKLADLPVQDLEKSIAKLSGTLVDAQQGQKEAVELFRRLKIDPKNIKDADELLLQLAQRFELMPDGVNKTALAVDVFGEKLGPKLVPFLNQGRAGIEALRKEARELGAEIGTETSRRAEAFNDNLDRIKTASAGAANALAGELLPSLVKGSEFFLAATKDAGFFQAVLISIGALMAKGLGIDEAGKLESRMSSLRSEVARLQNILVGVENILQRDPENDMAKRRFETLTRKVSELNAQILQTSVELARLEAGSPQAGGGRGFTNPAFTPGPTTLETFTPGEKKPNGPKAPVIQAPDSYMAYYREMLAEEERAQTILSEGRQFGKQEELAFWKFILDTAQVTTKDRVSILRRTSELEADIVRKAAADRTAVDRENIGASEELALARLDAERVAANSLLETHEISSDQLLELERQYEDRRYEIRQAALQQRLALAEQDPDANPAELARIRNEMLLIEQQHLAARTQINLAATAEQRAVWDGLWSDMQGGFTRVIGNFLQGTATLGQTVRGLFQALGTAIINTLAQMAAKWLVQQVLQRIVAKVTAAQQIIGNSAVAGSAGVASMAAAPFPLNLSAPAFGASMAASALSFLGAIPAAERGWIVPSGMNPITQLHQEEMVLPREESRVIQDMAANGGAQQAPIVLQGYRHGNFFITELPALAKALEYGKRNFVIKS